MINYLLTVSNLVNNVFNEAFLSLLLARKELSVNKSSGVIFVGAVF